MKRKTLFLIALLLSVCTLSFGATLQSLDKKGVMTALQDKTITTIPMATLHDKLVMSRISIYFGADGKLEGKFARKIENDPQSDTGTWTVKNDGLLCANWQHWGAGKDMCVYVYDTKNSLIFANPAGYFDSLVLSRFIKSGNHVQEIKSLEQMKQMRMQRMMTKEKTQEKAPAQ